MAAASWGCCCRGGHAVIAGSGPCAVPTGFDVDGPSGSCSEFVTHPTSSTVPKWLGSSLQDFHVLKLQLNEVVLAMKVLVSLGMAACAFHNPSVRICRARTVLIPDSSSASRYLRFPAC